MGIKSNFNSKLAQNFDQLTVKKPKRMNKQTNNRRIKTLDIERC